jgi:hypothetical protein
MVNCVQAISCSLTLVVLHTSVLCLLILRPPSRLLSTLISGKSFRRQAVWSLFYFVVDLNQSFLLLGFKLDPSQKILKHSFFFNVIAPGAWFFTVIFSFTMVYYKLKKRCIFC